MGIYHQLNTNGRQTALVALGLFGITPIGSFSSGVVVWKDSIQKSTTLYLPLVLWELDFQIRA